MTWEQGVAIATLIISGVSLIWNICNSRKIHKNNLELENVKSYYQLKQSKYALEFKAYEELSQMVSSLIGNTGGFILEFVNTDIHGEQHDKYIEYWNQIGKDRHAFVDKLLGYSPFMDYDIAKAFYSLRNLCSDASKIFVELEENPNLSNNEVKDLKQKAEQIRLKLIQEQGEFNTQLRQLIKIRIAETRLNG